MAKTCSTCEWWDGDPKDSQTRGYCFGWGPVTDPKLPGRTWHRTFSGDRCPRHGPATQQLYRIDWNNGEIDGNLTEEMLISMLVDGEGATSDTPFRVFRQDGLIAVMTAPG